jgi:hypothetical protein
MRQFILCMGALVCTNINMAAKKSFEYQLKQLNAMPIIQRYREYAFQSMNPTTQLFLAEFPNDPKSKIIERYLYQLSLTATLLKYCKKFYAKENKLETGNQAHKEMQTVYHLVPLNGFIYNIIVNNEIVENVNQLPYDDDFNAKKEWKNYFEKLEQQMIKDLQKTHLH